jgi:hypothetical protein
MYKQYIYRFPEEARRKGSEKGNCLAGIQIKDRESRQRVVITPRKHEHGTSACSSLK